MTAGSVAVDIDRVRDGRRGARNDRVAIEEPLEIRVGFSTPDGRALRSLSITMRTPGDDAALAAGFLFGESLLAGRDDILSIDACGNANGRQPAGNAIRVELAADVDVDLARLQRHFYTTSSCGVCGKASLDALRALGAQPCTSPAVFPPDVITAMPERLRALQANFDQTGGLHAAAAFDTSGNIVAAHEDVGRHNAVDKVIGTLLLDDRLPAGDLGIVVSGRASFELMQKALVAGSPLLAAVGAPSSLAVDLARDFGLTLAGFVRGAHFNLYSGSERIQP